tara:strand:+ start:1820 stop:2383 length:564 start_codon:yes stop_codon:yes gene_type:complete
MKKQRLMELAGIRYINEQSEMLTALIDTMSKELANDLDDDLSDPINVVIPEIIKRLTVVANDPKSGLSSTERAEIKDEIKKYQEALDTLANAGLVSNEANNSTQKSVVVNEVRSVSELDRAVKDKAAYKQFISSMDILLSDWYADGFTKQDVVNYMNQVLPASEPSNTSSSNDMPGFAGTRDALANI